MRRSTKTKILIGALLLGSSIGIVTWLLKISEQRRLASTIKTEVPVRMDITNKRVISGTLVPYKEVALTAEMSGVLDKLYVSIGDKVTKGMDIASIKVLPKSDDIVKANSLLHNAQIKQETTEAKYQRSKYLFEKEMLSLEQYEADVQEWKLACEEAASAQKSLDFILKGHIAGAQGASNIIKSTTAGIVSNLPCKEGNPIIERTSQGAQGGTTVATISDMSVVLFKGKVGEMDVAYLHPGMQFDVSLIAIKGKKFPTTLTNVDLKSVALKSLDSKSDSKEDTSIKFEIEGTVQLDTEDQTIIRAGYTAIADIVLEKAINVLAIKEACLHTETINTQAATIPEEAQKESTDFVWVYENNKKVKKHVKLGISDGIYVEVREGLTINDQIIIQDDSN